MESLAPPGRRLPSESKTLAMELVAAASEGDKEKELSLKTPEEMFLAANALHQVRPPANCCVCPFESVTPYKPVESATAAAAHDYCCCALAYNCRRVYHPPTLVGEAGSWSSTCLYDDT